MRCAGVLTVRQLVTVHPGILNRGTLLATLCRFDDKLSLKPLLGPFIPWERRLAELEILEIQGRDIPSCFLI